MATAPIQVLVVDDHKAIRHLLTACLEPAGYQVITAPDGAEAWDILQQRGEEITVVLLDRRMPRMDGMELLSRIKASPALANMPVIMETAADKEEDIAEGIRAGAYYYLTKPLQPHVVLSITAAAVRDHQHVAELRQEVRRHMSGLALMTRATFRARTLNDAHDLTVTLASACPDPDIRVLGLSELLVNAVEHGNLGISYEEKDILLRENRWRDEVLRRLEAPEYRDRHVTVEFDRHPDRIEISITDEGAGFDWRDYMDLDPRRALEPHGRGIALSRAMSFDEIAYQGRGNRVTTTIRLPPKD